jgi:hypothetical protein
MSRRWLRRRATTCGDSGRDADGSFTVFQRRLNAD